MMQSFVNSVLCGLMLVSMVGCYPPEDPMLALMDVDMNKTRVDDLSRTLEFVFSDVRFDQREFEDKVSSGLNRWVSVSGDRINEIEWAPNKFAAPVVDVWSDLPVVQQMHTVSFGNTDAWYLQQVDWLGDVVQRVTDSTALAPFELYRLSAGDSATNSDSARPLADVMAKLHGDLSANQATQLADTVAVFDWIIRNVQLLPEIDSSGEELQTLALNDSDHGPAAAGIRGTGYQRFPWQTLIYGRGDYVDRAKLFLIALDQLELEAVMLAVPSATNSEQQAVASENENAADVDRPWAVAVKIGDRHFLFDTRLGMPIPGADAGTIATLADVRENDKILKSLDLTVEESLADETDYWVTRQQLDSLTGLVYVSPEGISRRMAVLEASLVGDDRLPLINQPDRTAAAFEDAGVKVLPWDIAFQTHQFRIAVRDAIAKSSFDDVLANKLQWHYDQEAYIDQWARYRTSRVRYFKGIFQVRDKGFNAIESFQVLMYPDEVLDQLGTDRKLQRQNGVLQDNNQSAAEFQAKLNGMQATMRLVRRDAGFFLAQSHFDNGSVSTAANWLERLRSKPDVQRWSDGIDYLLGRALEGRKDYNNAIDVYRESESTQQHGNLIRARLLKQQIDLL